MYAAIPRRVLDFIGIAALTSERVNLSPFTKGCRERGVLMRLEQFFPRLMASTSLSTELDGGVNFLC